MSAPQIQYPPTSGGGAPVGGSGTTNTIPRWTGTSTLGDSVITQSGSSIGIGETSPASYGRLAVTGSAVGAGILGMNTDATRVDIQSYNKPLAINRAGNNTLMNEGGGLVGIGTASPGAQLQVERAGGLSNAEYLRLRNTTSGSGSAVAQDYYVHANTVATGRIQHTWNGTTYDTTLSVWSNSLSSLQEAVRVQGGGNVGIGTASPIGTLDVRATNPTVVCSNSATRYGYQVWNDATSEYRAGTGGSFPFVFLTGNLERARIDSNGNFAVGRPTTAGTIFETQGDTVTFRDAAGNVRLRFEAANSLLNIGIGAGWGLKLPATPGNADTQTLDAYQEIGTGTPAEIALTLTCGTSGTITVNAASSKARVTRVGNKVIGHGRIVVSSVSAPLGRLSCVLTGCPQPFTNFLVETQTDNTTGLASGNRIVGTSDTAATPTIYFDRYSPNTSSTDAAANIQAGTIIVFNICYSV